MESRQNMNFTKQEYKNFINELYSKQDKTYLNFHKKLLNNDEINLIGIRIPTLRKIAKEIAKNDYKGYIKYCTHQTYEENTIHGLILGYIKVETDELLKLIDAFLSFNNNWATNDVTVSNLKAFKKLPIETTYKYLKSENPWEIRFGLTLLLTYYINENNINTILKICNTIKNENYYVKMANAWLISICYIKYKEETLKYLKNNNLDKFTFNKAISKICDSYRVSKEDKEYLKTLKIKN